MNLLFAIVLLAGVGVAGTCLASYLSRHLNKIEKVAEIFVRNRMLNRKVISQQNFFNAAKLSDEDFIKAKWLVNEIANITGIDVGLFRPDDKLCEIFRVYRIELEITDIEWKKANIDDWDFIEVFIEKIISFLELRTDINLWEGIPEIPHVPRNDDEWNNLFLNTKLIDLIKLLVPLLKISERENV